jgi:toxin-antitoxin system PIN domain toxin
MTTLLDGNVLIALSFPDHVHASRAGLWFAALDDSFATCPITQGTLVRFVIRQGFGASAAKDFLARVTDLPSHVFWPDSIGYGEVRMQGVLGHGQVTDAYLAELAQANGGRLATFDQGLAARHVGRVELID